MISLLFSLLFTVMPPCEYEDSTNCSWDADTRGNGVGHSFVDIGGTAFYLDLSIPPMAGY